MKMTASYVIALLVISLGGSEGTAIADKAAKADQAYSFATLFLIKDFEISAKALVLKNPRDSEFFEHTKTEQLPALVSQKIIDALKAQGIDAERYESSKVLEDTPIIEGTITLVSAQRTGVIKPDPKVMITYRVYRFDNPDENIIKNTLKLTNLRYEVLLLKRLPRKLAREIRFSKPIIERGIKNDPH